MVKKRVFALLAACAILVSSFGTSASAVETADESVVHIKELVCEPLELSALAEWESGPVPRAFARINISVAPNTKTAAKNQTFSLEAGEAVRINCSYSPMSASVDFGLLAPDGYFYYERVTSGDINKAIQVDERGSYILAVRNNSSSTISVVGFVNY